MIFVINYRYISFKLPNYRSEKLLITENEKPVFFAFFLAYRGTYNQGKMLTQKRVLLNLCIQCKRMVQVFT